MASVMAAYEAAAGSVIITGMKDTREPRWMPVCQFGRHRIPAPWLDWLLDPDSLTARLRQACQGGFSVRVLAQGVMRPACNEARALGMPAGGRALIREVQLLCKGRPWVFARTVIPLGTLTGRQRRLAHLGNRPLGAVLFADPAMRRSEVEIAAIRPGHVMFDRAVRGLASGQRPGRVWGRRSVFRLNGKPLLVSEVFLPAVANTGS